MRHSMKPDLRADYKIRLYIGPKTRSSKCPNSCEGTAQIFDQSDHASHRFIATDVIW